MIYEDYIKRKTHIIHNYLGKISYENVRQVSVLFEMCWCVLLGKQPEMGC